MLEIYCCSKQNHMKKWQEAQLSQRGRMMLCVCLYLASTLRFLERSLLSLVTSASDLPIPTINFSSVLFDLPSRLADINKIHCCMALHHDGLHYKQMPLLSAINYSTTETTDDTWHSSSHPKATYWSKITIFAIVKGPYQNIAMTFGTEKLKWWG